MELETLILSEASQSHLYLESNIMAQMNFSTEKKIMDLENRLIIAKGEGEGMGWIGNLGSADANYCLWNG